MGLGDLHPESDRERRLRDEEAGTLPLHMEDAVYDAMEIEGTLEALSVRPGHRVLELGCGRGRFTRLIEKRGATVVGVDISLESLRIAADHIATSRVALVQADATKAIAAPRSFDRVLGTLTSNLPSRRAREDSYRAAAAALSDDGKLVFSTHHYGIRARLAREPKEGRYSAEGIYRYLLEPREIRDEIGPFFGRVRIRPICVVLPFSRRLGLPLARIDRIARRIPGTRSLGDLLLVEASRPTR
jgi:SAM-dependent methyltransferase